MDIFKPDDDERYDKRCGEIFLTTKGNITFHCTLCEMVYKNFDAYAGHLSEIHLTALKSFEDNTNQVDRIRDSKNLDTADIPLLKVECELLENEFLKEVEVPIDSLIEDSDSEARDDIKDSLSDFEKRIVEVETPNFTRKARKQATRKTTSDKSIKKSKQKQKSTEEKEDCLECRNTFKATTDERMRLHTCKRSFICYHCGRSYRTNSHLNRHLKRHTNQRDYKCQICEKAFYDSTSLRNHMIGHSNERPFKCKECPATFSRETALRNHMKLHENKREYKCHLCEKSFNQQAGLCTHMKITHKTV